MLAVIETALGPAGEHVSVVVSDVTNHRSASVNASRIWYAASLYKLPLLFEATWQIERGLLDPANTVTLRCVYTEQDLGTLAVVGLQTGDEVSIADAVRYMTIASDNSLAHLLNDLLNPRNVDAHLAVLGTTSTTVNDATLPTTASDIARILEAVAEGYPSQESADAMFVLLSEQWIRTRIPQGIPADATVGNKTGDYPGVAHDAAILRAPFGTYVIAMLTDGQVDDRLFVTVSMAVYDYLKARANAEGRDAARGTRHPCGFRRRAARGLRRRWPLTLVCASAVRSLTCCPMFAFPSSVGLTSCRGSAAPPASSRRGGRTACDEPRRSSRRGCRRRSASVLWLPPDLGERLGKQHAFSIGARQ